ncbi:MAG: 16S rRNA (cytosine(1402)-N(4))-methyltransferase RsmH [Candidatus Marinimicrobia bacterium]|nr:16S rRNA (cytosine(1402)-N(4))-methyltransferase RsmH [Candidatus Neomarinimicrobiota bacterium]
MMQQPPHIPIMVDAVVNHLLTDKNGIYLDGTTGFGGHASAIMEKLNPTGTYIGLDADPYALEYAKKRLSVHAAFCALHHVNYRYFPEVLASMEIPQVTGLFFDIGISSYQIDSGDRGFSFQSDSPLDMRFDTSSGESARHFLNSSEFKEIGMVIRNYGEERNWKRITRAIVNAASKGEMETTFHLKAAVESVTHQNFETKTLARVFQGIRIHVNGELDSLEMALESSIDCLKPGGRIGVISFHSLEDRIVKRFFKKQAITCTCSRKIPVCVCDTKPNLKLVSRKAIVADAEEVAINPRSRSAKFRVAERV